MPRLRQVEVVDEVVGGRETGETERREPGDDRRGRCRLVRDVERRIEYSID
jgi:hypothetical protein